jgi:hypothetical protein
MCYNLQLSDRVYKREHYQNVCAATVIVKYFTRNSGINTYRKGV